MRNPRAARFGDLPQGPLMTSWHRTVEVNHASRMERGRLVTYSDPGGRRWTRACSECRMMDADGDRGFNDDGPWPS